MCLRFIKNSIAALGFIYVLPLYSVDVNFRGTLHDVPCTLGNYTQDILFEEMSTQAFNSGQQTGTKEIKIQLNNCSDLMLKQVKISFSGDKELEMQNMSDYYISVTGKNRGKLAIAIYDSNCLLYTSPSPRD